MNDKCLKRINKIDYYSMFNAMDLIIRQMKNRKIYSYWKKNCFKYCRPTISYTKYMNLTGGGKINFLETCCDIHAMYYEFYHCVNMSIDCDVNEYINTLNAIAYNIRSANNND